MDIDAQRRYFPALANKIYLNFGGQGPLPSPAIAAIQQAYEQGQIWGPFSRRALDWVLEEEDLTRTALAQMLHVAACDLTLTQSTTQGCAIVLWGWPWQTGDHLLLSDGEHPGVVATVAQLAQRFGLQWSTCPLSFCDNDVDTILAILDRFCRPRTRMMVLSHILWHTGQVLPLAAIGGLLRRTTNKAPGRWSAIFGRATPGPHRRRFLCCHRPQMAMRPCWIGRAVHSSAVP
jgi:Selenocysteine lyase